MYCRLTLHHAPLFSRGARLQLCLILDKLLHLQEFLAAEQTVAVFIELDEEFATKYTIDAPYNADICSSSGAVDLVGRMPKASGYGKCYCSRVSRFVLVHLQHLGEHLKVHPLVIGLAAFRVFGILFKSLPVRHPLPFSGGR